MEKPEISIDAIQSNLSIPAVYQHRAFSMEDVKSLTILDFAHALDLLKVPTFDRLGRKLTTIAETVMSLHALSHRQTKTDEPGKSREFGLDSLACPPSSILLSGPKSAGKVCVLVKVAEMIGWECKVVEAFELWSDAAASAEKKLRATLESAAHRSPCILVIRGVELLAKDANGEGSHYNARILAAFKDMLMQIGAGEFEGPLLVIGTTTSLESLPPEFLSVFSFVVEMEPLQEVDREALLHVLFPVILNNAKIDPEVDYKKVAQKTVGFSFGDLVELTRCIARCRVVEGSDDQEMTIGINDLLNRVDDISRKSRRAHGAPGISSVHWEDVGGLEEVKRTIISTIKLTVDNPELFTHGLRRSGILLYGPPGCGKTLLAKAAATECNLSFLSVKGPELLNMYVGQSEQNVRDIFTKAKSMCPCVIFFDELDSLAPNRGRSGDSGGVMDRVVSQMLAELDGIQTGVDVFVIGATNRPDLIDPSMLRPGRFDKPVYVGIDGDQDAQLSILKAATRKLHLAKDVNLKEIVDRCPSNVSGADLSLLASNALMKSVEREINKIEDSKSLNDGDADLGAIDDYGDSVDLIVAQADFIEALTDLTPSISIQEMQSYQQVLQ